MSDNQGGGIHKVSCRKFIEIFTFWEMGSFKRNCRSQGMKLSLFIPNHLFTLQKTYQ